jgi:hypothetical protein
VAVIKRQVAIDVLDEVWMVPYGFGKEYRRLALEHIYHYKTGKPERLFETVSDILGLVGYEASEEAIKRWGVRKRVEAQVHASNEHLRASDNPIRRHPRPSWMPDPWLGPERGEGIFGAPGPTRLD